MVWLNLTVKRKRFLIDHGHRLLGLIRSTNAEAKTKYVEDDAYKSDLHYKCILMKAMSPKKLALQTSFTSIREEQVAVLKVAVRSTKKTLKNCFGTGFKDILKAGKVRKRF